MSDIELPPPPPPAPLQTPSSEYDVMRPFGFVFQDPRWLPKVLLGGVFVLLSLFVIGIPFLLGYLARLTRNVIAGDSHPLPEWQDLGEYFREGLLLLVAGIIYMLPVWLLMFMGWIVSFAASLPAAMGGSEGEALRVIGGGIFGCAQCIASMVSLAVSLVVPAAMLMVVTKGRLSAAFEFRHIWAFINANIGRYLIAVVVQLVASLLSAAGLILFCIGIIFTQFWSAVVTTFAFAEVYRLSSVK